MIFSSLPFLFVFLPAALILYYTVGRYARNLCLFCISLVFYAWGEPRSVFLLLGVIAFDYACGLLLARVKNPKWRKAVLSGWIALLLAVLAFYKYSAGISSALAVFGAGKSAAFGSLPVGISFYTFESISYAVDVYRHDAPAQRSFVDFGTFLSLFPHLIAGPIVRYRDLKDQLTLRRETLQGVTDGSLRLMTGLFKKVLLADQLAQVVQKIQYAGSPSALSAWLCALAFTFQVYFDFSGYSDMAIGLGRMFGFVLPENFSLPYLSGSVSEFWRRWHITLGMWFRDYLYIPLGGSRCSRGRTAFNLAVVWLLTGLWHGAGWNFVVWGCYWGLLIILEKFLFQKVMRKFPIRLRRMAVFLAAVVGWVFFSSADLPAAFRMLGAMAGFSAGFDTLGVYTLLTAGPLILCAAACSTALPSILSRRLLGAGKAGLAVWSLIFTLLFAAAVTFLVNNCYSPFLYAQF